MNNVLQQAPTDEQIQELLKVGNPDEETCRLIRLGWQAALAQQGEQQPELDVRKIMLDVVPGEDGMGEEVYATCVADVVRKLSELGQRVEDWELGIKRHAAPAAQPVAYDDKCCTGLGHRHVMQRAHALCPTELSHTDKMAWIADYFVRNAAAPAVQPDDSDINQVHAANAAVTYPSIHFSASAAQPKGDSI